MNKKILIATLGLSLVLTLSACSGEKNKAAEETKNATEGTKNAAEVTTNNKAKVSEESKNAQGTETVDPSKAEVIADKSMSLDLSAAKLTKEEAFDNFKKLHPDAKVESLGLEAEGPNLLYKIDGYDAEKEYEVTINAVTGDVIKDEFEVEKTQGNVADVKKDMLAKIDGFVEKAIAEAGDGFIATDYTLEFDNGKYLVEVEVEKDGKDISYAYDLATGKLVEKDM